MEIKLGLVAAGGLTSATVADGSLLKADHQLAGGPSVLFDAVAVVASADGTTALLGEAAPLLDTAGVEADAGIVALAAANDAAAFTAAAGKGRFWARETMVRTVY